MGATTTPDNPAAEAAHILGFVRRGVCGAEPPAGLLPLDLLVGLDGPPKLEAEISFGFFHPGGETTGVEIILRWYRRESLGNVWPLVQVTGGGYQLLKSLSLVIKQLAEKPFFTPDEAAALLTEAGLEDLTPAEI